MRPIWQQYITEAEQTLETSVSSGLSTPEAQARLEKWGLNVLKEKKAVNPLIIFLSQFDDFIVWILVGAALVSGFLQEWVDSLAIIAIIVLNALLGFIQEYRAERSLAALKKMSTPTARVIREGQHKTIPASCLVPGDLLELEAGDHVAADSRLVWTTAFFSTMEASLTGESTPVTKTFHPLNEKDVPLADRANMVYLGTAVSSGKARALVADTGMRTELGKIAGMIQESRGQETPLQKKLEEFGRWIVYLCFVLVGLVFVIGVLRGGWNKANILAMFLTSVSLAVAAIPEGLPAVVTIALALGVQRMVRRHALIRKLPSVETLGCATVICSDKTGTLTKNEMTVGRIYADQTLFEVTGIGYEPSGSILREGIPVDVAAEPGLTRVLLCSLLCNGADLIKEKDGRYTIAGDPTEAALLTAAAKAGMYKSGYEWQYPFVEEIPFDSERKKMSIIRKDNQGKYAIFVKGAVDVLLGDCALIEERAGVRLVTAADRSRILEHNAHLADQAMRVLAVAYRVLNDQPNTYNADAVETDLIFAGLVGMSDPARPEVKDSVKVCVAAGIRPVMITGDHKNTAVAVARDLGILHDGELALTGAELGQLSDEEFAARIEHISVYARVSPEHKLRIVRFWRARHAVVAMTGDGVNDAPALKEADIGVAMGITGTDVSKEVADMVVTDDNFASIVAAVEEGRGIYDNIKKFIHYLLSCNTGEILVMFIASLIGWPVPLLPIQILWVNLVTDGLPALALGVDPVDPDIMKRPPRAHDEGVIDHAQALMMLMQGAFIAVCSLTAFCLVLFVEGEGIVRARTAAFIVLSCAQLFHSFNCRNARLPVRALGFFSNPQLIVANLVSFGLQMAVVYVGFFQRIFKTEPLGLLDWVMVIAISSFPLWAMEIYKSYRLAAQKQRQ